MRLWSLPLLAGVAALGLAACGGSTATHSSAASSTPSTTAPIASTQTAQASPPPRPRPHPTSPPRVVAGALGTGPTAFVPAVRWRGQTAVWVARSASGVALLSLDQQLLAMHLHSGTLDAGSGFPWGPAISDGERHRVVAAFNGGFRLNVGAGGFSAGGHVAVPLRAGLGSVVTYADGRTDIGSWRGEVPAAGQTIASVRQNLSLLIDHGAPAGTVDCRACWGATLGGVAAPARSALGITADGHLIWAGGENLTAAELASSLLAARVVRAVQLDINPEWVAAYLYARGGGGLDPLQVVPGQHGVPGFFLSPYSRDFFTVVAR